MHSSTSLKNQRTNLHRDPAQKTKKTKKIKKHLLISKSQVRNQMIILLIQNLTMENI